MNRAYRILLLLVLLGVSPRRCPAVERPNIVFILADDLGYGDVRCLNSNGKIATPNIDRLATEGRVFTDAHSSSAVCTPTRYSILTGRYNWRSRLKSGVLGGFSPQLIELDRLTVAGYLKANGYTTAGIGETKNVQAEHPDVVKRLTNLLEKYVADGRSTPGKKQANTTPVEIWR